MEKAGFRATLQQLNEMFPDVGMLTIAQAAQFIGVNRNTAARLIKFNELTKRVTKADFARQVCT